MLVAGVSRSAFDCCCPIKKPSPASAMTMPTAANQRPPGVLSADRPAEGAFEDASAR